MPSTYAIRNRVRKLQRDRGPEMLETPLYDCIVDGEHLELDPLEIAYTQYVEGKSINVGPRCNTRYTPKATPAQYQENLRELDRIFAEISAEHNSPEAKAQRKAEYEELQRIGELRRQDCLAGRNMDECHPLPWTKKGE